MRDYLADWFTALNVILFIVLFIPTLGASVMLCRWIGWRINHWRLYDILLPKEAKQ